MIDNLSEYFLPEQQFYLYKIAYDRVEKDLEKSGYLLNCTDNINVELNDQDELRIVLTRSLFFDPEAMFQLSVSFAAELKLDPMKKNEYEWKEVELADEFRDNGDFVTMHLMSRISLLIAQITSSFGQVPLVLPPNITKVNDA